jgi:RNA polymerase sigma-70 factor (ECF subfamily)
MREPEQVTADEDAALVLLCKKGDVDAFESLVVKHQKMMINIAYRMLGNYEEACEIVQDAFVAAYKSIRNFRERAKFSTWLYTIVMNHSRNRLKQLKTQRSREEFSLDDPVAPDTGRGKRELAANESSVLERLETHDLRQTVQRCIDSLFTEFKEVLILRDIQSFSYGEISDILHIPEGTVKSRLFRARDAVKDCLKNVMGDL